MMTRLHVLRWSWAAAAFSVLTPIALGAGGSPLSEWEDEARLFGLVHEDTWAFGESVDISGDLAIVGAPDAVIDGDLYRGAAYIFRRSSGAWIHEAMLIASDGSAQDGFGWSVAIEGNMAIVGTPFYGESPELFRGAVYVFQSGGPWVEVQRLLSSDGDEQDHFGFSVALEGNVLVVGSRQAGPGSTTGGAGYVFEHDGASWVEDQKLFDPKSGPGDGFGTSVALDGNTIAVGDNLHGGAGGSNAGAVYVFTKVGMTWMEQQKLEASDAGAIDLLGTDVALDGDTLLAGAEQKIIGANVREGAAYLFTRSKGVWTEQQRLTASNGHEDSHFGTAVALAGGLAVVGAELDFDGHNNRGVVYEFGLRDGVWEEVQWFAAPMGQGLDSFGEALDLDGERLIVGNSDNIMVEPHGTAWIFLRPLLLFADGFESGDTSAWATTVP